MFVVSILAYAAALIGIILLALSLGGALSSVWLWTGLALAALGLVGIFILRIVS